MKINQFGFQVKQYVKAKIKYLEAVIGYFVDRNKQTHAIYVYIFETCQRLLVVYLKFSPNQETYILSGNPILQSYEIPGTDLIKLTLNDQQPLDNCTKFD